MNSPGQTPPNFHKILFAVDGSPETAAATNAVGALAALSQTQVKVLHVWNTEVGSRRGRWDVATHAQARQLVDGIAERLSAKGLNVTTGLRAARQDRIAEEIALGAGEFGADVVALGSRGRSDLGAMLLGSVSHQVLRLVHCPVLIARLANDQRQRTEIKRVLLAVATGDEVPHAVEAVTAVARGTSAKVQVLHVRNLAVAEGMAWVESNEDSGAFVTGVVRQLRAAGVSAEGRVASPSRYVANDIATAADQWDADLIVIGSRRLSELGGLLASSVSHEVIHVADHPVLVAELSAARAGD